MPTLFLVRGMEIRSTPDHGVFVVAEDNQKYRTGWLASVGGQRVYVQGRHTQIDSRPVRRYGPVPPGLYDVRSMRRAGEPFTTSFEVKADRIRILDEPLNMAPPPDPNLPPLMGKPRQVAWAQTLRADLLGRLGGYPETAEKVRRITEATWFIANRDREPADLRLPDAVQACAPSLRPEAHV